MIFNSELDSKGRGKANEPAFSIGSGSPSEDSNSSLDGSATCSSSEEDSSEPESVSG